MKIIDLLKVINTKTVSDKVLDLTENTVINNINLGYGLQFNVKRISASIPNKHYDTYTYIAVSISDDKDNILCYAKDIDYFIETLNTFGRDMSPFFDDRKCGRIYNGDEAGFEATLLRKLIEPEEENRGDEAGFEATLLRKLIEPEEENREFKPKKFPFYIHYLALKALNGDIIYLESVDCHAIATKARRILNKCTEEKLVPNNLINIIS